jgi:hypothetical protein
MSTGRAKILDQEQFEQALDKWLTADLFTRIFRHSLKRPRLGRCTVTKRGERCKKPRWPGSDRCLIHHTKAEQHTILEELLVANQKGESVTDGK